MIHVTCDLCGKQIRSGEDHFIVKIEAFPAHDPSTLTEADLDEDHMELLSQYLTEHPDDQDVAIEPCTKHFRYDLCPDCKSRYLLNPLNKEIEAKKKVQFSEN